MDCRDVQNLLHPYSDGELDLIRHLQIENHLDDCKECAERARSLRQLRGVLASTSLYHHAPDGLRAKLRATAEPLPTPSGRTGQRRPSAMLAAMAAGIFVLLGAVTAGFLFSRPGTIDDRFAERVVAGHVRSLQVAHATDVVSSDRHTVKPWFLGKVDFSPRVPDLSPQGYTLSGGRLDYLIDRPVAALVYHRRAHLINVFTWPAPDDGEQPVRSLHRQGFQIRSWQHSGMVYWAISDLNDVELDEFVRLFQEHTAASPS
jgi:anti-sigma factor RsiW